MTEGVKMKWVLLALLINLPSCVHQQEELRGPSIEEELAALEQSPLTLQVTTAMKQPEYMERFFKGVCNADVRRIAKWSKKKYWECERPYRKAFLANLAETYPEANWAHVQRWCDANPVECGEDMRAIESTVERSHRRNHFIHTKNAMLMQEYLREEAAASRARALSGMLQQMSSGFQRPGQ